MKFGPVPVAAAGGATAVHTIRQSALVLKKGTHIGEAEIKALQEVGVAEVVVVRLEPGDVSEDEAAADIATAMAGEGTYTDKAFTGRCNLFSRQAGLLVVERDAIDRINRIDEAITVATLAAFKPVVAGEMLATVKIIPFAVKADLRDKALAVIDKTGPLARVVPYAVRKVGIVSTVLPGLSPKIIDKTLRVTKDRLAPSGAQIVAEKRVAHEPEPLATAIDEVFAAGAELVCVFGASAIADRRDVIPAAVEAVGGTIAHFGMPVDPGNLMMIASVNGRPVIGAPGCARSPKENGFDWVLNRLLAGLEVTRNDVTGLGVGGLLMEIVTRPQPRDEPVREAKSVAAIVLAAGRSSRMGDSNKLLADYHGKPLVRIAVEQALASKARPVIVVTGHQKDDVTRALAGLPVEIVYNPDYAQGLGYSLRAGVLALPDDIDGVVVCLGDMPKVTSDLIDRLIASFDPERGNLIVVPTSKGQRGNPVLWAKRFIPDLKTVDGDTGARKAIGAYAEAVTEVPVDDDSVTLDIDTPTALASLRADA